MYLNSLDLKGGGAYTQHQITELEAWLPEGDSIRVLELGAGDSSIKICKGLENKYDKVTYVCYETNGRWAPKYDTIEVRLHTAEQLRNHDSEVQLGDDEVYDFILVDGPDGVVREKWYYLLKEHTIPGTIIHIDDYSHYAEFEEQLHINFPDVEELSRVERGTINPHTWLTVRVK